MKRILLFLLLASQISIGQNVSVTFNSTPWGHTAPGWVYLNAEYAQNPTKSYPVIVFIPGLGEASSQSGLLTYGPSKFVAAGNKMEFNVNGTVEKPIIISIATGIWPAVGTVDYLLDDICKRYRIEKSRIYLTGLSMGGGSIDGYVSTDTAYGGRIAAIVAMHAVQADATFMANNFAATGGKWWGIEGKNDWRGMKLIADAMNAKVPGSSRYTLISSGAGADHCCWNTFYDPSWTENGDNIYTWLLKKRKGDQKPFESHALSGIFARNNCPPGYVPGQVTYNLAAATFTSTKSQEDADKIASDSLAVRGQRFANETATCTASKIVIAQLFNDGFQYIIYKDGTTEIKK